MRARTPRRPWSGSAAGGGGTAARGGGRGGPLRRAQVSFAAVWTGEAAFTVGLAVVAFRGGGLAAVGTVTAVRMAAAALLTPPLATVADRVRREWVLLAVGAVRAVMLGGAALVTWAGGPVTAVYGFAVVATVALALYRPAHSALLPALAASPADLTAASATRGMVDAIAAFGGPVIAAGVLAAGGPSVVFVVAAAFSLLGGLVVAGLRYDPPPRAAPGEVSTAVGRDLLAGFTAIARDRSLSLITTLGFVQTFTRGCLTVFTVVVSVQLLRTGDAGVGVLNSAVGAGGILGALWGFTLVGRGRLATWFGLGVALFGAPLALIGVVPERVTAIVLLAVVGAGNALLDLGGFTMLARLTDETVLARMFAGFEATLTLGVAAGGLITPWVVGALGPRAALVATGLLAPVAVAVAARALRRLDTTMRVRDADVELLRRVPMLAALPAATIDQLGASLGHVEFPPGQAVFRQGEVGDAFFVVASGRAEVVRHGRVVNTLGSGEGFGEVALLGDRPRTASVRASADRTLQVAVLPRSSFLVAVTGYPASAAAGRDVVARVGQRDADLGPAGPDPDGPPNVTGT